MHEHSPGRKVPEEEVRVELLVHREEAGVALLRLHDALHPMGAIGFRFLQCFLEFSGSITITNDGSRWSRVNMKEIAEKKE